MYDLLAEESRKFRIRNGIMNFDDFETEVRRCSDLRRRQYLGAFDDDLMEYDGTLPKVFSPFDF